jgi:hypothetical protein
MMWPFGRAQRLRRWRDEKSFPSGIPVDWRLRARRTLRQSPGAVAATQEAAGRIAEPDG